MKILNRPKQIADAVIADPEQHTVTGEDGGVRSIQAANVTMPAEDLDRIWSAMHLERLARAYWKYLSRVFLGVIRVHYTASERSVMVLFKPFTLLRFHAPEYDISPTRGIVRWRIKDGLLVDQRGRDANGYLEIDVRRQPNNEPGRATVHVEVEIANFYPRLAFSIAKWFYANTQSRVHVIVTHGFLRSLARLDLEESRVGRFARFGVGTPPPDVLRDKIDQAGDDGPPPPPNDVTEGSTPWLVVAALAAAFGLAITAFFKRR